MNEKKLMSIAEFKESNEYKQAINTIVKYKKGYTFTIPFYKMTKAQENAMRIILKDCCKNGLIESISIGLSLDNIRGNGRFCSEETYKRL